MGIKKHVCVLFLELFIFVSFIFCVKREIGTPKFLPNVFRKQYVLLVYRSLRTCPPPLVLCVQSRQHNHAFYQLIIFSLTNNAPVKHFIIYVGGIYRDPPQPDFCLLPPVCLEIFCIFFQLYACV